jgi:Ca-activated chloride channel family protein
VTLPHRNYVSGTALARLLCLTLIVYGGTRPLFAEIAPSFSAETRLVLVPVTVTDHNGRAVADLQRHHFQVTDNSKNQDIATFGSEQLPVSLGVALDMSGSMEDKLPAALAAVRAVLNGISPEDQTFLMTFADRAILQSETTADIELRLNRNLLPWPKGGTALIDAIRAALERNRTAKQIRRALLVVTDGGDNASRYRQSELMSLAREADTQIYSISIHGETVSKEEVRGYHLLEDLSKTTGGLHFAARNREELALMAQKIADAMKHTYFIGYKPAVEKSNPGQWRKIGIKLLVDSPKSYRVSARSGYSSP